MAGTIQREMPCCVRLSPQYLLIDLMRLLWSAIQHDWTYLFSFFSLLLWSLVVQVAGMPQFAEEEFSVRRRFNDFVWLHAALVEAHPGVIAPPLPEKILLGRFDPQFIEVGLPCCVCGGGSAGVCAPDDRLLRLPAAQRRGNQTAMNLTCPPPAPPTPPPWPRP